MAPLLEPTLSQKTLRSLLALSPFAPVSFTFVPCAMRCTAPVFFFLLSSIDSLVPLHTDSKVFPQLLWGWMKGKGRAKWWFQWHSFLSCRWRRARVGVWGYVWVIRLRKCRWIWSRNFFFFFRNYLFGIILCNVILFSCNWNNGIIFK